MKTLTHSIVINFSATSMVNFWKPKTILFKIYNYTLIFVRQFDKVGEIGCHVIWHAKHIIKYKLMDRCLEEIFTRFSWYRRRLVGKLKWIFNFGSSDHRVTLIIWGFSFCLTIDVFRINIYVAFFWQIILDSETNCEVVVFQSLTRRRVEIPYK